MYSTRSEDIIIIMLYFIRSLGMLKEAEIIEQQMMLRAGVGATQAQQPDYSAQWAEYYR